MAPTLPCFTPTGCPRHGVYDWFLGLTFLSPRLLFLSVLCAFALSSLPLWNATSAPSRGLSGMNLPIGELESARISRAILLARHYNQPVR